MHAPELMARVMSALGETRVRYIAVSAAALALDTVITLNLTWSGFAPALAAAAGYVIGLTLHWVLSRRFVFAAELASAPGARARQAALFVLSGLGGLICTVATFTGALALGLVAPVAKAIAVIVSFCAVYLVRRHFIFPLRA